MRTVSKPALLATLFVFFLDNFGLYVVLPIFTPLILKLQSSILHEPISIEGRMFFLSILIASFPLAQFFGAPLFGIFGDRFGRKKALLLTLFGEAIGYAFSAYAISIESYSFLIASRFLTGFFAGNLAICLAIVSDHTDDKIGRYRLYGLQTGLMGLSFVLAVSLGGFLSNKALGEGLDPSLPFWITCGLALFNIIFINIFYQESTIVLEEKEEFHPFRTLRLRLIFIAFFLFAFGYLPTLQFLSAYLLENFDASQFRLSLTFAGVGIVWFIGSVILNPILIHYFAPHKITLNASRFLCLFLFLSCFAPNNVLFDIVYYIYVVIAALVWSGMTTKISFDAPPEQRGRILGITQSILTLAALLGPIIIGYVGEQRIVIGYYFSLSVLLLSSFVFYYYFKKIISSYKKK